MANFITFIQVQVIFPEAYFMFYSFIVTIFVTIMMLIVIQS